MAFSWTKADLLIPAPFQSSLSHAVPGAFDNDRFAPRCQSVGPHDRPSQSGQSLGRICPPALRTEDRPRKQWATAGTAKKAKRYLEGQHPSLCRVQPFERRRPISLRQACLPQSVEQGITRFAVRIWAHRDDISQREVRLELPRHPQCSCGLG